MTLEDTMKKIRNSKIRMKWGNDEKNKKHRKMMEISSNE